MNSIQDTYKKPRQYHRITPKTIADFAAQEIITGNGSQAVRIIDPGHKHVSDKASRIRHKSASMPTSQYIDDSLQQIASKAIVRLDKLVESEDEAIATRNVHYAIDQIRGKAVQKSVSLTGKVNIQSVLD